MKTSGKEYFYTVSGLMLPKYIVSDTLVEDIEFFVDWVPKNAKKLEFLLDSKNDMKAFISKMEELYKILCSIYAHWLETEAAMILRLAEINENELCRKLVVPLITNMNTLAIDIQMAQNQGFETGYRQRDEIERYRNVITNMKIISVLLANQEFGSALDTAIVTSELQGSEYSTPLMASITSKNVERAQELTDKIIDVFSKKIDDITSAAAESVMLKTIVIVDDMPEILTALGLMLRGYYQVFAFTNGKEALSFIDNKQQPDAFLLDIDMPDMDGFALAKKIRDRQQYEKTPILFLTGVSTRETLMKSMLYDAKAFIVKPANKDIIISKLSNCMQ